jgi:hypothetical protein
VLGVQFVVVGQKKPNSRNHYEPYANTDLQQHKDKLFTRLGLVVNELTEDEERYRGNQQTYVCFLA